MASHIITWGGATGVVMGGYNQESKAIRDVLDFPDSLLLVYACE